MEPLWRPKTESETIDVAGLVVEVVRKRIKNMYIRVDPIEGVVRVSAPITMNEAVIRSVVDSRTGWVNRWLGRFGHKPPREFMSGERHDFGGRSYVLNVVEQTGAPAVRVCGGQVLEMQVRPGADASTRRRVMEQWYRSYLENKIPGLVRKWEPTLGVKVTEWRIKRMKTRWGSCNTTAGRIWLNLELAKKSTECLEYVVVHEMTHLLERGHNARFYGLMDRFLPGWRVCRDQLNQAVVCDSRS